MTNILLLSFSREQFTLKSSPGNGKAFFRSSFFYATASVGAQEHVYVRCRERRLHFDGHSFVVRNRRQSGGFDEEGKLRLW